jgi:SAM-dependent methyltransferase
MTVRSRLDEIVRAAAVAVLPKGARDWLRKQQRLLKLQSVPVGSVNFGTLRRLTPVSAIFGIDRDLLSVERWYIADFLARHSADVRGRVLEMGDPGYTVTFGGDRVTHSDVLHYVPGNPKATIVADLTDAPHIPDDMFDCIVITQTLQMILEVEKAIATLHRILKPGGVVLATSHGLSPVARREGVDDWGEYWHFTSQGTKHLFRRHFRKDLVEVSTCGNVLTAIASLHGLAAKELDPAELAYNDPRFELLVMVRAVKEGGAAG